MPLIVKDANGANQSLPTWVDAGYSCTPGTVVTSDGSLTYAQTNLGVLMQIAGIAGTIIRIKRIGITLIAGTAAGGGTFSLQRFSSTITGGTLVTPTVTKKDTNNAAAAGVVQHSTTAPTAGTWVGMIAATGLGSSQTTVGTAADRHAWEFGTRADQILTVRGASDFVGLVFKLQTAYTAGFTQYEIHWEEATT